MAEVILTDRPVEVFNDNGRQIVRRSVHRARDMEDGQAGRVRLANEWRRVVRRKGRRVWELDENS